MPQIDETQLEQIVDACRENSAGIAESLNQCFDWEYRLEVGPSSPWNADEGPAELDGPGLAVALEVGDEGILCLIPATLPLPEWYAAPGESEESRLQTLAMEWSINMLPADLAAAQFRTAASENLKQVIVDAAPLQYATILELHVFSAADELDASDEPASDSGAEVEDADEESDTGDDSPPAAAEESETASEATADTPPDPAEPALKLYLIAPVDRPPFPADEDSTAEDSGTSPDKTSSDGSGSASPMAETPAQAIDEQLLGLPVTVSVRLAEKKIGLGQLISLTPGGLITFGKSCEDLLDLYVNNVPFCRGEAIKIGEKFGMKVTQVGFENEREQRVL